MARGALPVNAAPVILPPITWSWGAIERSITFRAEGGDPRRQGADRLLCHLSLAGGGRIVRPRRHGLRRHRPAARLAGLADAGAYAARGRCRRRRADRAHA